MSSPAPSQLGELQVAAPFWLDRPDEEAIEIALEASRNGFDTMWLGEMATFDAFALATAVGLRAPGLALKIGPLAVGVRSPVALALGLASVTTLTGAHADLALGASSPDIVSGWHDRPWEAIAPRARETVEAVRAILAGERAAYSGEHVRTRGFRLSQPQPDAKISLAAFGPAMTRVAAATADEIVLNLVTPERVAQVRAIVDATARARGHRGVGDGRPGPWCADARAAGGTDRRLPAAARLRRDVHRARLRRPRRPRSRGCQAQRARREITVELLSQVCAVGSEDQIRARLAAYRAAGATRIGIVPATAEDPAGHGALAALGPLASEACAA